MKSSRFLAALALCSGLSSVVHAQTLTLVHDTFASTENRQSGALSADRANWYVLQNTGGNTVQRSGGSDGVPFSVVTDSTTGTGANAYMVRWTPVALEVGQTMTVSLAMTFTKMPASSANVRLGVFDSTPNGVLTADSGTANVPSFVGDTGYVWTANSSLAIGPTASGTVFRLGERTTLTATPATRGGQGFLGVAPGSDVRHVGLFAAIPEGLRSIGDVTAATGKAIAKVPEATAEQIANAVAAARAAFPAWAATPPKDRATLLLKLLKRNRFEENFWFNLLFWRILKCL